MAFDRFTSDFGVPSLVVSDNATGFVAIKRRLHAMDESIQALEQLPRFSTTEWVTVTPLAPFQNGAAEIMVRAFKRAFQRIASTANLTREEFETVAKQVQAVVNCRPLTTFTNNEDAWAPLRPCDFFASTVPSTIFSAQTPSDHLMKRYRYVQTIMDKIWNRFVAEYLPNLHERTRWNNKKEIPKVGDIVVIMDDANRKTGFPLGRILSLSGHDNHGFPTSAQVAVPKRPQGFKTMSRSTRVLAPVVQPANEIQQATLAHISVSAAPI